MFQIYGWEPEYYNDPKALPEDMPKELQDYIIKNATKLQVINYFTTGYFHQWGVCLFNRFWKRKQKKEETYTFDRKRSFGSPQLND